MNGFTEEQMIELITGTASFDSKLDALIKFAKSTSPNRGRADKETVDTFFAASYTEANLVGVVIVIGDKIISNYIHNLTNFEIDFPIVAAI
jgi:alkylhydroperoxidase family enzyme